MAKDYFSTQADRYKLFRPTYPSALFEYLCRDLKDDALVWDCATGNGQAAESLSHYARHIIASDQSMTQLRQAPNTSNQENGNIVYVQALAERLPITDRSIDLLTVAQALHWFDFEEFYREMNRVIKPGGKIAAWTYSFLSVCDQLGKDIENVVRWFYHDVVGPYWPPERRWVDEQYQTIPFPFRKIDTPNFTITVNWDLAAVVGYISSWSAVKLYKDDGHRDPIPILHEKLAPLWPADANYRIQWTLGLRVGVID